MVRDSGESSPRVSTTPLVSYIRTKPIVPVILLLMSIILSVLSRIKSLSSPCSKSIKLPETVSGLPVWRLVSIAIPKRATSSSPCRADL